MPNAREWHWIDHTTLDRAGIAWKPANRHTGRYKTKEGYIVLNRCGMTEDEIRLAEENELFRGKRENFVREHHLVAAKKYGGLPDKCVVRHLNGVKDDNRPENLVLGTTQENTMDHNTARLRAIFWREKAQRLSKRVGSLERRIARLERVLRIPTPMVEDWSGAELVAEMLGGSDG
jgi:hypothetical protein